MIPGVAGLTLVVLAKAPVPGRSKTRLAPVFGAEGAADLAAAALADTLDAVAAAPAARRVLVLAGEFTRELAAGIPPGIDIVPQAGGDHGHRIAAALAGVDGPALLIGMDTPQVTPALLTLPETGVPGQAWLGPAADGGWWALGLRETRLAHEALRGVPMSTPGTGTAQRRRLEELGLAVELLPELRDVDEPDDAVAVAGLVPGSRFARRVGALTPRQEVPRHEALSQESPRRKALR